MELTGQAPEVGRFFTDVGRYVVEALACTPASGWGSVEVWPKAA
jgi:hypothetical protein